jgi:hypothetical protein
MAGRFGVENSNLVFTREVYPTGAYQSLANLAPRAGSQEAASGGEAPPVPEGLAIGDPEQIVRAVKHWESIGVDGVNFMVNGCEVLSQAEVLDSMRLFAAEVLPRFRGAREL